MIFNYQISEKSVPEIAKEKDCSRPLVYRRLKELGIKTRSISAARKLAFKKNRISYFKTDKDGKVRRVTPQGNIVNSCFFSKWSPQMAWVLGLIYTDGCLFVGKTKRSKKYINKMVVLVQKEPEVLEKVKRLMGSNQKLVYQLAINSKTSALTPSYRLSFWDKQLFSDLKKIGLTSRKSQTMTFPDVPKKYMWHFIRGCWDGDGCIYIQNQPKKRTKYLYASFISGSKKFLEGVVVFLKNELSIPTININRARSAYEIRLATNSTLRLCQHFYDGISSEMFMSRKYNVYKKFLEERMMNGDDRVGIKVST